jgi:NADH-quinone oxidoreductase subunit J
MPTPLFWIFALIMLIGGVAVIAFRNPVSSALSVVTCFIGMAGLFVGLNAYFVAVIQILVYTGAVMVLFLFIIMLLDLKEEAARPRKPTALLAGVALVLAFTIQFIGVLTSHADVEVPPLDRQTLAEAAAIGVDSGRLPADGKIVAALNEGRLPDVHLIGYTLFTRYNLPLQILGVLLLVSTVGVVVLSKRGATGGQSANPDKSV